MTIKIKTINDLKQVYSDNKNHFDIVDILDSNSDLFELHSYIYRKATSLNNVYHTRDLNNVPAKIRKKLNLDVITSGANAEGMDFLETGDNTSIAFESKRYEEQNIPKPDIKVLRNQVIESLIIEELQLQLAERYGIRVSDEELNATITRIESESKK